MPIHYNIINYKVGSPYDNPEGLFKEFFIFGKDIHASSSTPWRPPTDVYETPDELIVKMSIPGTRPEDIKISFSEQTLRISGHRTDTSSHEKTCFYQVEIRYGYFERCIFIPKSVDADNIKAIYKDGFLQVTLPKSSQKSSQTLYVKINF